jgi:hypothetical protein
MPRKNVLRECFDFFFLTLQLMWEKTSFPSDVDLAQMTDLTAADWLHSAANKI